MKDIFPAFDRPLFATIAVILLGASGCITIESQQDRLQSQMAEETAENGLQRLDERISALQTEQERLYRELQSFARGLQDASETRSQLVELDRRLQACQSAIQTIDSARRADRQAMLDQVSKTVADLLNSQRASAKVQQPSSSSSGYEHVIQPGETLSAIAAAYKTTVGAILQANGMKDANSIVAGRKLFIPK